MRIQLLVVACIVPGWLLAVALSFLSYERERESVAAATVQAARSITQSVERELATNIAVLQSLSVSSSLDAGDTARFRERAAQILKYGSGDNILWVSARLQVLVNLAAPPGEGLLALPEDRFPQVMTTQQPAVSDYFIGRISKKPQVAVAVPVIRNGQATSRLEMLISPDRLARLLERQQLPQGWTASIFDSQSVAVARNRSPELIVGTSASPRLRGELQSRADGSFSGRTREGIAVIVCFSRSAIYGWAVAIGVPEALLTAPLKRALILNASGALVIMVIGLLLASLIGRRIAEPIRALVAPALAIGQGETAVIDVSSLREATELGQALQHAQELLRQREQARQQAVVSLHDNQSRLRMALDASQIGDWDLDLRTQALRHSLRHDQCFGYREPVADWGTDSFLAHVHPDDRALVQSSMNQALQARAPWRFDCRIVWPDGSMHWLASQGSFLIDDDRPYFMLGVVIDITDRKQNEDLRLQGVRLETENRQILEANRLKSEFLANMSHELRTPLNAIIGFAEILRGGDTPDGKQQEYLGYIASSGRHLLQLINDVLDLSKVESGKFEFFPEPVDLARVMREVTGVLQAESTRKGIGLVTELDPELVDLVLDPARLKQMLYNFLSNAIKFTGQGGHVLLRASAEGPAHLRIEVEDNGIGISEADQQKLFLQFQQVHTGYAKPHQGTGLGLALTKRFADLQGGSVGVRSTPGVGSVFHMVLPRQMGASVPLPAQHAGSAPAPGELHVLVVEDDVVDPTKLVQVLGAAGFHVDVTASGEQALELASKSIGPTR